MQNRNINQILLRGGKADIEYTAGAIIKPGSFLTTTSGTVNGGTINPATKDARFTPAAANSTLPIIAAENILGGQSPNVDGVNGKAFHQIGDVVVGYMPERGALLNLRLTIGQAIERGDLLAVGANGEVIKTADSSKAVAIADETWTSSAVVKTDKTSYGNDLIAAVIL